jgi:hypothetical protein
MRTAPFRNILLIRVHDYFFSWLSS